MLDKIKIIISSLDLSLILSLIIGTLIGVLVSFFTIIIIDIWKNKRIRNIYLLNLYIEIDENKFKKIQEIKELYHEIQNPGFLTDIDFIQEYKCNFEIFKEITKKGIYFYNNILIEYAYISTFEEKFLKSKIKYFSDYVFLFKGLKPKNLDEKNKLIKVKVLFRSFVLVKLIRNYEIQLIRIYELHKLIKTLLIKNKVIKKEEIVDSSKISKSLIISYLGEHEDKKL